MTLTEKTTTEKFNLKSIRKSSIAEAQKLNYEVNNQLPLLDNSLTLRPLDEIINRSLVLHAVIACSFGFKKKKAFNWLKQNNLRNSISKKELMFLKGRNNKNYQLYIESLNTFAWLLGKETNFNFSQLCSSHLINKLPNLKSDESPYSYIETCSLIDKKEIIAMADLAYCLHNTIVQENLAGKSFRREIPAYVIIARRQALEWVLSKDDWDGVNLDT